MLCTACTTITRTYPNQLNSTSVQLKSGDKVTLFLVDGRSKVVEIEKIENETIYYKGGTITYNEVDVIQVKRVSGVKTTFLIIGSYIAALATAFLALYLIYPD